MTSRLTLGLVAESTGLPPRQALLHASKLGCRAIQFDAVGELAPDKLGDTARREFRNLLKSHNLELAALNAPLRRGFDVSEDLQPRLDFVRKVMGLAYDLGSKLVVAPCPVIPVKKDGEEATPGEIAFRDSLELLGSHGDRTGTSLALEGGLDLGKVTKQFLGQYQFGSLGVCYDPANYLLNGFDPLAELTALTGLIRLVHARDARKERNAGGGQEVPVGAGDIEWIALVATLESVGYAGPLVIERTQGSNRLDELAQSVKFLKRFASPVDFM